MNKTRHRVTAIPGDGIGPELMAATRQVLEAAGAPILWEDAEAGADALLKRGTPLPDETLASIRRNKVALKGPVTTPIGTGFRSVNVSLRQELNLYACVRPCRSRPGVPSPAGNVDLILIRENTEDLYAGVEFAAGSVEAESIIRRSEGKIPMDSALSVKPMSWKASERIARYAFEHAIAKNRRKVTVGAKANIMPATDGLFVEAARSVAAQYRGRVAFEEQRVDALCLQLVRNPESHDVLLLPNLYGDILSDLCAGLVGGLGVCPGANIGDDMVVFEPVHGSAPAFAGKHRLNPGALLLSAVMMLEHLGETQTAQRIEQALGTVLAEGTQVTFDLKSDPTDPSAVTTEQMAQAIIQNL